MQCREAQPTRARSMFLIEPDINVDEDGSITGMTLEAKKLIRVLGLDSPEYREFRRLWIDIIALAKHYDLALFKSLMRYPDDLPDLIRLRPRANSRPEGILANCRSRQRRGELPETY
jgi:hypothetical protein